MKKIIGALLTVGFVAAYACWFTESNFNATYIASINGFLFVYIYL